jgi:hypothetical protein
VYRIVFFIRDFSSKTVLPLDISEEGKIPPAFISTLKKLASGYINGTRVALGEKKIQTSCVFRILILGCWEGEEKTSAAYWVPSAKYCRILICKPAFPRSGSNLIILFSIVS